MWLQHLGKDQQKLSFYLQVADPSVCERQYEDHCPSAYIECIAPFLVVHADVVLRFVEVEPGGL